LSTRASSDHHLASFRPSPAIFFALYWIGQGLPTALQLYQLESGCLRLTVSVAQCHISIHPRTSREISYRKHVLDSRGKATEEGGRCHPPRWGQVGRRRQQGSLHSLPRVDGGTQRIEVETKIRMQTGTEKITQHSKSDGWDKSKARNTTFRAPSLSLLYPAVGIIDMGIEDLALIDDLSPSTQIRLSPTFQEF